MDSTNTPGVAVHPACTPCVQCFPSPSNPGTTHSGVRPTRSMCKPASVSVHIKPFSPVLFLLRQE
eukprot:scaffold232185_cov22-Tisochrysis_lutea.AAC.1